MEILFRGIPLGDVTVSMTINSPAAVLWAMYLAVAEQQGVDWERLSGTLQNDILKEYIAQKEYIFPPRPSMRLVTDTIEFGARHTPRFNPISISGYHIREAGSTAVQELAFTLRDGMEYVDWALERGLADRRVRAAPELLLQRAQRFLRGDRQVPRGAQDLGATPCATAMARKDERSLKAALPRADGRAVRSPGSSRTTTWCARRCRRMAAVLGGAQSLHTNSLDEAYALPSEQAVTIALRTQQVLAYESGVADTPDPLGGSYFLEKLTLDTEAAANDYIRRIDEMGGMIAGHRSRFPAERDRRRQLPLPARGGSGRAHHRGRQPLPVRTASPSSCCRSTKRRPGTRRKSWRLCARGAIMAGCGRRWTRCGAPPKAPKTPCRSFWMPCAPTPRWARSATRCARCSAPTRRRRTL